MALKGNDLVITNSAGKSQGYVLCLDKQYGEPVIHSKAAPNVPMNTGSSTPAQAGGQYDVRDSDGDKAISHIDWTKGAGQRSLDADEATPFKFLESKCIDISRPGEIALLRGCSYTETAFVTGPVFSAMGYFWMGMDFEDDEQPPVAHSVLMHSLDGVTWTHPNITASPAISGLISCFASDGTNVYFGVATGANKGIWRGVYSGSWTFTKYGSSGSTEEIKGLAFNGGQLFASVYTTATPPISRVAQVDRATGVVAPLLTGSKLCTPAMFNAVNHIALVGAGNSVYWVVSQSNKSFIYKITYEPDTGAMMTEQYMEMPTGFIATCALGYLSSVYVGGYFESQTAGVGKGAVYVCADGYSAPLFEIGDTPEYTDIPSDTMNDNRINAICEAGKDLYVATNRGAYRWDIDGSGWSHSYDLNSGGAGVSTITWNPGSEYSYDGSDMTAAAVPGPAHGRFPSEWTLSEVGETFPNESMYIYIFIPPTVQGATNGFKNDGANCKFWFARNKTAETLIDWSAVTNISMSGCTFKFVGDAVNRTSLHDWPVTIVAHQTGWEATITGKNILTQAWSPYGAKVSPGHTGPAPSRPATWTHNGGIAVLETGTSATLTATPDGADELNNATGSTMEFKTGGGFAGSLNYTVEDGTKIVRFVIQNDQVLGYKMSADGMTTVIVNGAPVMETKVYNRVYILPKVQSKVCTGYIRQSDYDWDTGVWSYYWTWTWADSGNYYWYNESGLPAADYSHHEGRYPDVSQPQGEHSYPFTHPSVLNVTHPCTVRCTVLGNVAEMSVNGAQDTKKTLSLIPTYYNTANSELTIGMMRGVAIDSWNLNSKDGYPAQNEVEVLGYAGIAYNKGRILSPYMVASDSTSGIAMTGTEYSGSGYLTQSETSFHSGTLKKDFRSIDVAHSIISGGGYVEATVWIDGEASTLTGIRTPTRTRFPINKQGYSIKTSIRLVRGDDAMETPLVRAVNVMWDFVKIRKHQYNLHCTEGAKNGTWRDNPQDAISFLYDVADQKAVFEDAFVGSYEGSITDVSFLEANPSTSEGYSGVLKVIVREADA